MLYGTTREFLRIFGLSNLDDLPNAKDLREAAEKMTKTKAETKDCDGQEPDSTSGPPLDGEVEAPSEIT